MSAQESAFSAMKNCYNRLPRWFDWLIVVAFVAFVSLTNLNWAAADQGPPISDSATHAYHSVVFHNTISNVYDLGQTIYQYLTFRSHYPPLSYQVDEIGYVLMGLQEDAALVGMIPFLLLMAISVYYLVDFLAGRIAGLTAAVMVISMPSMLEFSRVPFVDMQLAALVAFSLATLVRSCGFSNRQQSLLAGIAIGGGMMAKWTFPLFVIIPLLVALYSAARQTDKAQLWRAAATLVTAVALGAAAAAIFQPDYSAPYDGPGWNTVVQWFAAMILAWVIVKFIHRNQTSHSPLAQACECLLIAVAIIGPWYANNRYQIVYKAVYQANVHVNFWQVFGQNLEIENTWFYLSSFFVPLGLGIGLWKARTRSVICQLLLSWILVLASLSLAPNDARYILPTAVYMIAIGLCWMENLGALGLACLAFFGCIGIVQASYYELANKPDWPNLHQVLSARPYRIPLQPIVPMAPRLHDYPFKEVIAALKYNSYDAVGELMVAAPQSDAALVQPRALLYYATLSNRFLKIHEVLLPDRKGEIIYDEGQPFNYLIMYPDILAEERSSDRVFIPNDATDREEVLERAALTPEFPKHVKTIKTWSFGPDIIVELVEPAEAMDFPKKTPR